MRYGFVGRRLKKRNFRSLWIVRINAACRGADISYSKFISGLKRAGVDLNRKVLAEIAVNDRSRIPFTGGARKRSASIATSVVRLQRPHTRLDLWKRFKSKASIH